MNLILIIAFSLLHRWPVPMDNLGPVPMIPPDDRLAQFNDMPPMETPILTEYEVLCYQDLIAECLEKLKSPDFRVREKSYHRLADEPWHCLEPFLPRKASMEIMVYLKRLERSIRPEMREWQQDYVRSQMNCEKYALANGFADYSKTPDFSRTWISRQPKSIFEPEEPIKLPQTFKQW